LSRIDFRLIRAFCAVYEEGSITKAAERLRIAQPNISVAIKNLEFDLRKKMFERSTGGVTPTPVAKAFYSRLQPALADIQAAHLEARKSVGDALDPLRVGVTPILAKGIMPGLLPSLLVEHPGLEFRLTEGSPSSMVSLVSSGELDLAFILAAPVDSRFISEPIMTEPVFLISSTRNCSIPRGPVDLTAIPPFKFAVPWGMGAARHPMTEFLSSGQIPISQTINVTAFNPLLDLVRNSDWMTVLPISALAGELNDLVAREVVHPNTVAEFFVIRPPATTMSAAANFFIDGVKQTLAHARQLCEQHMANISA
jgi:LysR family transcriptional regulator, nitrogen assimilation regulatory protein